MLNYNERDVDLKVLLVAGLYLSEKPGKLHKQYDEEEE
jgi:hypothetical protein